MAAPGHQVRATVLKTCDIEGLQIQQVRRGPNPRFASIAGQSRLALPVDVSHPRAVVGPHQHMSAPCQGSKLLKNQKVCLELKEVYVLYLHASYDSA